MKKKPAPIRFLLTLEQWLGVLILALLAVGTLVLLHIFQPKEIEHETLANDSIRKGFSEYQVQQDSIHKAQWKKKYPRDTVVIRMQKFDPNTADSITLVHLGLKKWQASNMLKYRAKGGRYRTSEDMKRLYGMTDSMYMALQPYICIDTTAVDRWRDNINSQQIDSTRLDTLPRYVSQKRDTILNLRTTDTTELKMIRGIGSYRAKQIIRYREQLGGFTTVEQLREVKALQTLWTDSLAGDSLLSHFFIDSVVVRPLQVNSMRVEQLQRHPYLSFEQAKAIYELRRRKIHLDTIEELQHLECFTNHELQRLSPYLSFKRRK